MSAAVRSRLAALAASLTLLPAARAAAQSERPALALSWSAPRQCPQQARARRAIAEYLGETQLAAPRVGQRVLRAEATIVRRDRSWELHLETELDDQPGERTLAAGTCADVADAAALVLAFAIDPGAALRHSVPPAQTAPAAPAPPAPAPTPTRWGASASVRADLGALPGLSVGLALGLLLEHGPWSGNVTGFVFAGRAQPAPERPSAGGDFSLWAVAAAPCWAPAYQGTLRLRLCLPVEWQRLHASGYGVDVTESATRSEFLLGAQLAPGLRLSPDWELIAPFDLALALRRPEFYLERIGTVFRASALQGRAGLGLLARF